jgi:hypothetical protein
MTTHTTEVSLSEWDRNAAEWQAKGWQLVKITTFRSGGVRKARVLLARETDD